MSRTLVIEPEAEAEINESVEWYEQRNPAARAEFVRSITKALRSITDNPEQYQVVYRTTRRVLVEGFPYALFYVIRGQNIHVISCFHTSRNPRAWRDRLR